jgi:hypothetical protein
MTFPRSPYDQSVADTFHWARFIDKVRQHLVGTLPNEYAKVLGHSHGVDGQFLDHFGLTIELVTKAVDGKTDTELAEWLERTMDNYAVKRNSWNELAPNLGKPGFPMDRIVKIAVKRIYKEVIWSPELSVFDIIDIDEGRA